VAQVKHNQIAPGVYWLDTVGSTQDAVITAQHDLVHGEIIATGNQTDGRGRADRTWTTPPGSAAAMSLILRPKLDPDLLGILTLVAADGLVHWFRSLGVDASVKWPNDVQGPDTRKLCGILAQWLPETNAVVVGIGTNINFDDAAPVTTAGSLADYGVRIDPQDFVITARRKLLDAIDAFVANPDAKRLESTMTTVGQRVRAIMPDGNDIIGTAVGLGATGSLLIQGETDHEVLAADIVHLRPA